ncbi:cobalamin biosynthesis protein CobW [Telmatospirillum siberiense]|uniref:Cobalamin biosynthesis protein CobW n=1 Tax=Telmatospirillum siberiense TaxID=382514 RepID=A0A2N3PMX5_9PROT|nr:cobalamin biosynthesis protein CobW [Telmatospirillum siberiense]PKU21747.1 cobalamin biosynthesis protein CobW [Telmatospirillum siberiense]
MNRFRKIPATVITGFLGAGKTTLVRHLLSQADGRRIALIVNEFGDVGVDGDLLSACGIEGCREDDIIELANGCLCCTVADEFLPAMERLLSRPLPPEHIIIETSGLALPKPLVKAFDWPDVRSKVTVDGVVVVVDGPAMAAGRFESTVEERARPDHDNPLEEVFDDQLACADMVLLNKADLMEAGQIEALAATLKGKLRPGVKLVATRQGDVDARILLGLEARAEDDLDARPTLHDTAQDHNHDDFESFAVPVGTVGDPQAVAGRLGQIIARHDILRLKGFLSVAGKDMRHVVQAVGGRISGYYDRPWKPGEERAGQLVVIGLKGLDREAIRSSITGDS